MSLHCLLSTTALIGGLLVMLPACAGTWGTTRTLEGPFAVSSPPDAPQLVMNAAGDALVAWNATGRVRYAEKRPGAAWSRSATAPGGGTGAGPVAVAIGGSRVGALAWTTVATRYVPSKLLVSLRAPGGSFGPATELAPGSGVWTLKLGIDCDGGVTLLWLNGQAVHTRHLAGQPGPEACTGQPGTGPWSPDQTLSDAQTPGGLPDLAVNDAGAALAVWQQPTAIVAALRPAGSAWGLPEVVSAGTGLPTWNPKPVLAADGRAAVGYLDGESMFVVQTDHTGAWAPPVRVSGTQRVLYPALAGNAQGGLLAAWQVLDAANQGAVWHSVGEGGAWAAPVRLSAPGEAAGWPSAAWSADGSVALVGWVDDTALKARVAVGTPTGWTRSTLGGGWWGGTVPVAAGAGAGLAGWGMPEPGNPNAAKILARAWQ